MYVTDTKVIVLTGSAKNDVADLITALNIPNPLHWSGLPGD